MSELLYILGEVDWRVRPLVFAVRSWACEIGLTNPTPGRWITNFSLTLLVLFYLQQQHGKFSPVLPTLNTMISLAGEL
jgi:poly(A) RNA polymerase